MQTKVTKITGHKNKNKNNGMNKNETSFKESGKITTTLVVWYQQETNRNDENRTGRNTKGTTNKPKRKETETERQTNPIEETEPTSRNVSLHYHMKKKNQEEEQCFVYRPEIMDSCMWI